MDIRQAPRSEAIKEPDLDDNRIYATISLVLGIASILLVLVPSMVCGAGMIGGIIGIILGTMGLKSRAKLMAIIGIVLSSIGIIIGILNIVSVLQAGG